MSHSLVSEDEVSDFLLRHNARSLHRQMPAIPETFVYALDSPYKCRANYPEQRYCEIPDIAYFLPGTLKIEGDPEELKRRAQEGELHTLAIKFTGVVRMFGIRGGLHHIADREYPEGKYFGTTPRLFFDVPEIIKEKSS